MTVDRIAEHFGLKFRKKYFKPYTQVVGGLQGGERFTLVKPLTYMNRSGEILPEIIRRCKPPFTLQEHLIIICDTMDLPVGMARIKRGGSTAGHNGIRSIISHLGRNDFIRVYIGVGRPHEGVPVVEHVLSRPDDTDMVGIVEAIDRVGAAIIKLLAGAPLEEVMHVCNRKVT